jgi:hypothetical protein
VASFIFYLVRSIIGDEFKLSRFKQQKGEQRCIWTMKTRKVLHLKKKMVA